jgi:cellulose synthase operon protein C
VSLLTREGKTAEARAKLEAALAASSSKELILERLGDLDLARRDGPAARGWFEKLVGLAPENLEYQLGLAGARVMAGDRESALAAYQRLQKSHGSDVRVWLQAGALLAEMGRNGEARASYEQALQRDRRNPFVLNNLAWLLVQSGQEVERALEYAQEAKRLLRQAPEVDGTLGAIYTKLAMHRNAVAVYEEMLGYVAVGERARVEKLLDEAKRNSGNTSRIGMKVSGL